MTETVTEMGGDVAEHIVRELCGESSPKKVEEKVRMRKADARAMGSDVVRGYAPITDARDGRIPPGWNSRTINLVRALGQLAKLCELDDQAVRTMAGTTEFRAKHTARNFAPTISRHWAACSAKMTKWIKDTDAQRGEEVENVWTKSRDDLEDN